MGRYKYAFANTCVDDKRFCLLEIGHQLVGRRTKNESEQELSVVSQLDFLHMQVDLPSEAKVDHLGENQSGGTPFHFARKYEEERPLSA